MIKINGIKQRDDERQIVFFTIDGQEFSCGNVPIELTTQTKILKYLNGRSDEFTLLILRTQYPESDHLRFQKNDKTELQAMKEWITKGHKNKIQIGETETGNPKYEYQIIEKKELEYKHPPVIKLRAEIDSASTIPALKEIIRKII